MAIAPELKFYDQSLADAVLTVSTTSAGGEHNPSATISLNTVVQGDGESNRDGRQISMVSIGVRGNIRVNPKVDQTSMDSASINFVALVLDTQTNGALLRSEDVFVNIAADNEMTAQPWRNLSFTKRFRVLASQTVTFERTQETSFDGTNIEMGGLIQPFNMFVDLKGMKTTYSNTSETIANIVDNGLNIVAFTSSGGMVPLLNYSSRLRFMG